MDNKMYVNFGEDDQMEVHGYRFNVFKVGLTAILAIPTNIFLALFFYWRPDVFLKMTHSKCDIQDADYVLLEDQYDQAFVCKIYSDSFNSLDDMDQSNRKNSQPLISSSDPKTVLLVQRNFFHRNMKYVWQDNLNSFEQINVYPLRYGIDSGRICSQPQVRCMDLLSSCPLTDSERILRRQVYGMNAIKVHVQPIIKLLITQVLSPFYIFQVFSVCLWFGEEYYYYAGCIILISAISITAQIYQQRTMERALKKTIESRGRSLLYTGDFSNMQDVGSDVVVPGDVICLPKEACVMHCDAVLISGSCIVNESMLTGESIPATKTPLPGERDVVFDIKDHSRHVLYGGTRVLQTRSSQGEEVRAVVIRTGFSTAKGGLVRSILYPKPLDFKFTKDSYKYVAVLGGIALGGMIYTLVIMITGQEAAKDCIIRTLDLVTIVIPPALPAAMTVGIVFAQRRLRKRRVYCISPRAINISGTINVFCFDKTGTLTGEGLELWGIKTVANNKFSFEEYGRSGRMDLDPGSPMFTALSTCHSLSILNGSLVGDPLDAKMFEFTEMTLKEEDDNFLKVLNAQAIVTGEIKNKQYLVGILKQFTFTSKLQRMSVLTRQRLATGDSISLFCKGSPEMIKSLSRPESVPEDFERILVQYTELGYRVIALAYRPLYTDISPDDISNQLQTVSSLSRQELEQDLIFLGLLILENRLKPETKDVIKQLKYAEIRPVMVTGDNMLTALSVARECGIVDVHGDVIIVSAEPPTDVTPATINYYSIKPPRNGGYKSKQIDASTRILETDKYYFAVSGKSWKVIRNHFAHLIPQIVVRGAVFARFSPDQKQQLIEALQELGYYVGMCGDGANDCGALKAAHAGISLSDAEASVASPFTSKDDNITCVPSLISEGRAALVTSFGIFKYMAGYSMTQFLSVCILYWRGSTLTDLTFLYQDLVLLTTHAITFCYTGPYDLLAPRQPMVSLVSLAPIVSLLSLIGINTSVMLLSHYYTTEQPWYEPPDADNDGENVNYDVTSMFLYTATQYITMAIILSKSSPYRKRIYTNIPFMINILICTVCTIELILYPAKWMQNILELKMPPSIPYRAFIVGISILHFFFTYIVENYIIDPLVEGRLQPYLSRRIFGETLRYKQIEADLRRSDSRPSVSRGSLVDLMKSEMTQVITTIEDQLQSKKTMHVKDGLHFPDGVDNRAFLSDAQGLQFPVILTTSF